MAPSSPPSSAPTAARSAVGIICTAAAGTPAEASPASTACCMASAERRHSEPPRRISALPERTAMAAASTPTFGRAS